MGPSDGQQELWLLQLTPVLHEDLIIFMQATVSVALLHSPSQVIRTFPVPSHIPPLANMLLPAARFFLADTISWPKVHSENFQ